jgi:hypothetical protein
VSRYDKEPLDFTALKTIPIRERGGKVRIEDFARAYEKGAGLGGWLDRLPRILAGDSFREVVDAVAAARAKGKPILWGLGGHVVKCGLAPARPAKTWRPCCPTAALGQPRRPGGR